VSGKYFVSTLNNRRSQTHEEPSHRSDHPESVDSVHYRGTSSRATIAPPGRAEAHPTLQRLEMSSYVEAVLWLMARLADGLAHAHDRGIVHRDLKPANILLTDDGQPMLLDFNLSANPLIQTSAAAARLGGTLPYMSPEQLESFQDGKTPVGTRTDIYSLGLVIYQLLIGRYPFASHKGSVKAVVPAMLAERFQALPTLRDRNRAVTPATEAIIQKCLAPDADKRYLTAQQLVEDLERQLNHQPLKYAPEPSWRERARKWSRRHPVLTSATTVGIVAAVVLAAGASTAYSLWNHHLTGLAAERKDQARLLASENLQQLRRAKNTQQALLRSSDRTSLQHLSSATESSLAVYGVLTNANWQKATIVSELPETDQVALRKDVAEMLMTWSEAEHRTALSEPSAGARTAHLTKAMSLNSHAELCLDPADRGKGFWQQRASLAQLLGLPDAAALADRAVHASVTNARDHFTLARELVKQHEFKRAIPLLAETTRLDPQHFWAWHYLGNCHFELLNFSEALTCYSACRGLNPDPSVEYYPHYHLALVNAAQGRFAAALDDVDRSIACLSALPPDVAVVEQSKPYLLKARVLAGQKNPTSALAALTSGLKAAPQSMELLFERANLRRAAGDVAGADADQQEALKIPPATEIGWNVRGLGRLPADPVAALADFETALKINPDFHEALQNKAHVLSEHLDRPAEALAALDRLIAQYPGYVRARVGRAVLFARKGQREPALTDVRESLARDRSAGTLYQAANVFALTSRQVASDRDKVIPLLAAALWGGFGLDVVDTDSDMDPVRESPAFRGLIAVVRELEAQIPRNSN
jgi:serine/threonine protein kinase